MSNTTNSFSLDFNANELSIDGTPKFEKWFVMKYADMCVPDLTFDVFKDKACKMKIDPNSYPEVSLTTILILNT